jgi:hypothetical protein
MTNASEMATDIARLLTELKKGSLVVFGDIFGGRIDNIHSVVSAESFADPERLLITFDEGETLEILEPSGSEFGPTVFRISRATRVRWEWFYYGRPQTPENRFFIEHVVVDGRVDVTTNRGRASTGFAPAMNRNAVELRNGWND